MAVALDGPIYTSMDSGATWVSNNAPLMGWTGVASSWDGRRLAAASECDSVGGNLGQIYNWQSDPAPPFRITHSGVNVTLTWVAPCPGWTLQQTPDLRSGNWSAASTTAVITNGQYLLLALKQAS